MTDIVNVIYRWGAHIGEMRGEGVPGQYMFSVPGVIYSQAETARSGIVIYQGEFPKILVRRYIAGRLPDRIIDNLARLLATGQQGMGKNTDAEVRPAQVDPKRAIIASGIDTADEGFLE